MSQNVLYFKENLEILKKVGEKRWKKRADLAKEFGLTPYNLSTLVGKRGQIMLNVQRFGINKKTAKTSYHAKIEVLLMWFREVTAAGTNINGKGLGEKVADVDFCSA